MKEEIFSTKEDIENESETENKGLKHVTYAEISSDTLPKTGEAIIRLQKYLEEPKYKDLYIYLYPFINDSAISIPTKFSLYRAYHIFRTMGLRHLVVVDEFNCIKGIITRKDLMDFKMLEAISKVIDQGTKERKVSAKRLGDDSWDINDMWDTSIMDSEIADMNDEPT